jgi:hypothetical protein
MVRVGGARARYEPAIAFGHREWTSWAAFNLGALLEDLGDTGAATAAYRQAVERAARRRPRWPP